MFCGKCGNQVNDNAKFCPKCGAEIKNNTAGQSRQIGGAAQSGMSVGTKPTGKKKKINSKIIVGIAVAVVIIIAFVLIRAIAGGNSAEKVALKACRSELDGDIKSYYSLIAPPYLDYMVGSGGWYSTDEEFQKVIEEDAAGDYSMMEAVCGTGVQLTYSVYDVTKCEDESQLNRIKSELSSYYNYDSDHIKDAAVVTISVQGYGSEGADNWTIDMSCVKIDGKWYIHRPGFDIY